MEDDDEFGDLYTDVLRPLTTQSRPQREESGAAAAAGNASSSQSRPIDLNRDDEEILYGAPDLKNSNLNPVSNPSSALGRNLDVPIQEKTLQESRGFDLNLDSTPGAAKVDGLAGEGGDGLGFDARVLEKDEGVKLPQKASGGPNFMEDDDDINILVEERENKDEDLVVKDDNFLNKEDNKYISATQKENAVGFMNGSVVDEMGSAQIIPGLSGRSENPRGSNFEDDWESEESEDDLQIVLNDNNHVSMRMGMERMPGGIDEDDDDGDQLLIVADNGDMVHHHHQPQLMTEDQEWGGEEGGPGANGEKDLGDAAKASGGGSAVPAVQPKIAYNNQGYHHPFHSQFKYVRPGAAPLPGAAPAATGGIPGQVRPPVNMAPLAGRGRGDWRPSGIKGALPMQKGFHPGYGMPAWGANAAGRGYGSGLDFTLPSHKTIFEVDIDSFEEKPWKLPGMDVSDFFNFGLNEDSWKDYCKQLEQLRLETTMQSKIRVYESGRAEQDYDPDLPPELAAAVGIQDIPSGNANPGKADAGPTDLARASARGRPPLPVGRPIPVETGSGDRTPSIDTRRPRMHDTDAIIEIVCHSSTDEDDMTEQQDKGSGRIDLGGGDRNDLQQDDTENMESFSPAYSGPKTDFDSRRSQLKNNLDSDEIVREDVLGSPPEVPVNHRNREIGVPNEERSIKGRGHIRSPMMTTSDNERGKHVMDDQGEKSFDSGDGKRSPTLSSSRAIGSDGEQTVVVEDDMNDGPVMGGRNFDMERGEKAVDATTGDTGEDGNLMYSTKKQKLSSRVKQLSQEDDDGEDSKAARSSDNSKAMSGSSKDRRRFPDDVEDEVLQDRRPPRGGHVKRQVEDTDNARRKAHYKTDETGRHNPVVRGREDTSSCRGEDTNSSLRRHGKSESADWRKESDISEASLHHRRDDEHHRRRSRVEDPRKREHGGETVSKNWGKVRESEKSESDEHYQSRNQLDNSSWRGANHDHDIMGSRQRDRAGNLKSRNEKVDDLHSKRRKEDVHISREHAEKEDVSHNHRESSSRRKREKDDGSDQLKRDDLLRLKDDDVHYARQKEGGPFQRERSERQRDRDEWYRIKQEEASLRRDREETRPVMRSGRAGDDKAWISHSRVKDDYKGSNREYHPKDVGRHGDQLKRRDRVESETFSQHRAHDDVYARENQLSNDEKKARYERPSSRDGRAAYGSDTSRVHEHKRKESSRKSKELESGDHSSLVPSKRNQDDHGGEISETVNMKGRSEHQSGDVHMNRQSSRKHREEASSDDEQPGSKRGRSKLERWTSHKERDFGITAKPSSSLKNKDLDTYNSSGASLVSRPPEETSKKMEDKQQTLVNDKDTGAETNNVNSKVMEDKHLDTVAKLKKRSERFRLPLPSEKDAVAVKKMESEPLPSGTEICPDSEIKSERPARKRRWTSN